MKLIDLYKTRDLKFRMSSFNRMPVELETGIWAVTGQTILKEGEVVGLEKSKELMIRRDLLRKEKPYGDSESHLLSHRGNVVYPDGQLTVLHDYLSNEEPRNLYLLPENPDYKNLFLKLKSGALQSGLTGILQSLGYDADNDAELKDFINLNKEQIQEKISEDVFKQKFDPHLRGVNISDKFEIAYVLDQSVGVYISYNDDHINQATIVNPRVEPNQIIGIILNDSKIEFYKKQKYSIPTANTFIELAHIHLATLRAFIDWFDVEYFENPLNRKLADFIRNVPESFFYVDNKPTLDNTFTLEEIELLDKASLVFWKEHFPFDKGESLYNCLIKLCEKYEKPLYSSDNKILYDI